MIVETNTPAIKSKIKHAVSRHFLVKCLALGIGALSCLNLQSLGSDKQGIQVDLRAGTSLTGEVVELTSDSLTLNTEHGEVVLKIRDVEQDCWERIINELPATTAKKVDPNLPKKKRFVSEILADKPEEVKPNIRNIQLAGTVYEFRKSFDSANNSAEFIYSPKGQPDHKIAKDNLTIWVLDNSEGKPEEEIVKSFLDRFQPDTKNFKTSKTEDGTLFFGERAKKAEGDVRFVVGKIFLDASTAWVLVYTHTNSTGEMNGWKTDKLELYKTEVTNFIDWPSEIVSGDANL
jgi:hypothetical protein